MLPTIVAHRGDAEHFPENSLPALEAAWQRGLRHVEFDVQLSADGVPYLIHDADLERTTGITGDIRLMQSGQLDGTMLPRLSGAVELMAAMPAANAFVEIKRASLVLHGHAHCVDRVLAALAPVLDRCCLISFDAEACRLARTAAGVPIGWVLDDDPVLLQARLESLGPEYAFCDHRRLPAGRPLPAGAWTWVVYEINDAGLAIDLHGRGVAMVESMAPFRLSQALAARACQNA